MAYFDSDDHSFITGMIWGQLARCDDFEVEPMRDTLGNYTADMLVTYKPTGRAVILTTIDETEQKRRIVAELVEARNDLRS